MENELALFLKFKQLLNQNNTATNNILSSPIAPIFTQTQPSVTSSSETKSASAIKKTTASKRLSNVDEKSCAKKISKISSTQSKANETDSTHALVQWQSDLTYTVLPISSIKKHNPSVHIEEEEVYKAPFNSQILDARVVAIGTSQNCKKVQSMLNPPLPKSKPTPATQSKLKEPAENVEVRLLKEQIEAYKVKFTLFDIINNYLLF